MKPVTKNRQISGNSSIESNFQRVELAVTSTLFDILSEKLYQNPVKSGVTETVTNGVDAIRRRLALMTAKQKKEMQDAGKKLKIVVTCPTIRHPYFIVRDEGTGIDNHADVISKFFGFNQSDKTSESTSTGSMGLGAKSVYAIAQQFTFTVYDGKTKRVYMGLKDQQGFPLCPSKEPPRIACDEPRGAEIRVPISNLNNDMVKHWQTTILDVCRNIGHDKNPFEGTIEVLTGKGQFDEKLVIVRPIWVNLTLNDSGKFAYSDRLFGPITDENAELAEHLDTESDEFNYERENAVFITENCALLLVKHNTHNANNIQKQRASGVLHYANISYSFNATEFKENFPWLKYYKLHVFLGNTKADGSQHPIIFNPSRESLVAGDTDKYLCDLASNQVFPIMGKVSQDIAKSLQGLNLVASLRRCDQLRKFGQDFHLSSVITQITKPVSIDEADQLDIELGIADRDKKNQFDELTIIPSNASLIASHLKISEDDASISLKALTTYFQKVPQEYDDRIDRIVSLTNDSKENIRYASSVPDLTTILPAISLHPIIAVSHKSIRAAVAERYFWTAGEPKTDQARNKLLYTSALKVVLCKYKDDVADVAKKLKQILEPCGYTVIDVVAAYKADHGSDVVRKKRTSIKTLNGRLQEFGYKYNPSAAAAYGPSNRDYWLKLDSPVNRQEIIDFIADRKKHKVVYLLFDSFAIDASNEDNEKEKRLVTPNYFSSIVSLIAADYRRKYQKTLTVVGVSRKDRKILEQIPTSFISLACKFIKANRKQLRNVSILQQFMQCGENYQFSGKFHPAKYMFHPYTDFAKESVIRSVVKEAQNLMPSIIDGESFVDSVNANKLDLIRSVISASQEMRHTCCYFLNQMVLGHLGGLKQLVKDSFKTTAIHQDVAELVKQMYAETIQNRQQFGYVPELCTSDLLTSLNTALVGDYVNIQAKRLQESYPLVCRYLLDKDSNSNPVPYRINQNLFRMLWVQDLLGDKQTKIDEITSRCYGNDDDTE